MKKYNNKLVYDYIVGNDIEEDIELLENDLDFMKKVISYSKDKNMYFLCSEELKNNLDFIKHIIQIFKTDIKFICDIADEFLKKTKDEDQIAELNIIMKELTKNCDDDIKLKYNLTSEAFYNSLIVDIEICRRKKFFSSKGFVFVETLYENNKNIMYFLAEQFIIEIFKPIDLQKEIHRRFKTYDEFIKYGKNNYLIHFINCFDSSLAKYISLNVNILKILDDDIRRIGLNWNLYNQTREDDLYNTIIEKISDYMEENQLECSYSDMEILNLVSSELNIIDKIQKYSSSYNDLYQNVEDYLIEDSLIDNCIVDIDETYSNSLLNRKANKKEFSFNDFKHYFKIKKMVIEILKNEYDEYKVKNDLKNKSKCKVIKFNQNN